VPGSPAFSLPNPNSLGVQQALRVFESPHPSCDRAQSPWPVGFEPGGFGPELYLIYRLLESLGCTSIVSAGQGEQNDERDEGQPDEGEDAAFGAGSSSTEDRFAHGVGGEERYRVISPLSATP
jgi:hypothetical protein